LLFSDLLLLNFAMLRAAVGKQFIIFKDLKAVFIQRLRNSFVFFSIEANASLAACNEFRVVK
jgi:hypothetical protein